ncbi:hypothetical protein MMC07_004514 [Pseudocyphellaria aurata]|nr:hypothetical protein [Pseudocyphellaria aurata]
MAPKVLIVLTSHDQLGDTGRPSGWYLPEFAHPYDVLEKAGVDITVASPKGGEAPLDPSSIEAFKSDEASQNFLTNKTDLWKNTQRLSEFVGKAGDYDALFYVGGHGPMFDLATDSTSHKVIAEFWDAGKVVSAVCHGPAALVNAKLSDGSYLIQDKELTAFSNAEEDQMGLSKAMPFMLETDLVNNGAKFVKADEPFGEKVVVAGRLITGQNPASALGVGKAIKTAITA